MGQRTAIILQHKDNKEKKTNTKVFYCRWGIGRILPSQLLSILYATITEEICSDYARKLCPSGAHDATGCFKQNELNELDFNDPSAIGDVLKDTSNNNGGIFIRLTTSFTHIDNFEYAYMLGCEEGGDYKEFCSESDWIKKTGRPYINKEFKTIYSKTLKYFGAKEYTKNEEQ